MSIISLCFNEAALNSARKPDLHALVLARF